VETTAPGRTRRGAAASPQELGRTTGVLYTAGGVATALAGLADPGRSGWLLGLAGVALATGVLMLVVAGHRVPRGAFHVLVVSGTLLVSVAVLTAPTTTTALVVAAVYTFVALDVLFYFRGWRALAQLGVLLVAATWTTTSRGLPPTSAAALCVVLTATAGVVGALAVRAARASHDPLTGLVNRRGFEQALDVAVADADRTGAPIALALVDVDAFKAVNDARGHAGGDALLRSTAAELRALLPAGALVGRLGGDEFAVALPRTDDDTAARVVEAARARVHHPLSVGVASRLPEEPVGEWLRRADAALYEAKQLGRDRTVVADEASGHLARDLAAALAAPGGGGQRVELQPVVDVPSGRVKGVEALARWDHPERGQVPPSVFVAVAEQSGQVGALGAFVHRAAFRDTAAIASRLGHPLVVSVNASGHELVDPDYAGALLGALAEAGLAPTALIVEVTESVVEGGSARALQTLSELRAHGVGVAVDDFGAGYSTLSRLDEVPADFLKLDGALLDGATTSPRRRALLEAAIAVGGALGLPVVAEGVETAEQAALLVDLGCSRAQGYYFCRPHPAAELLARCGLDDEGRLTTRPSPAVAGQTAVS